MAAIDLVDLRDRLRAVLPKLSIEEVTLEHTDSRARHAAISLESTEPRQKDHVYRMVVAVIGAEVCFFVHVHGVSKDLSTEGAQRYSKVCESVDEVFAIVHSCWTEGAPS